MSEEIQAMKQLVSQVDKLKTAKSEQQFEPILQALQRVEQYMEETVTADGRQYLPELMSICVNFIINHKAYPERVIFNIEAFIKSVLKYISNNLQDEKVSQMFRVIMDPSRMIYEHNAHRTEWHDQFIKYSYSLNPQYKDFIDQLQIGTYVDCLRLCRSTARLNWSRGVVEDRSEEGISIRYLNEQSVKRFYNIRSGNIMPYRTRSQRLDQMFNLQVGQVILATQSDKWILSTIQQRIEEKDIENIIKYNVAFRFYTEDGNSIEDESQKKYIGYNHHYDEQITACHPRLALCGDHVVRKFNSNEQYIDDSYDILYEQDYIEEKFYAILRPKQSKSFLLIQFINHFGNLGGFEKILNIQSVDILANYMSAIGNIHAQLFRSFCQEYVPKLQSMRQILLHSDEQTLRNMGREKMNLIIQAFKVLLDRIMNEDQRREWLQKLSLEFVQICFNCNFLDKKIMGLKLLTDMLKQASNDKCPETILQWIDSENIMETLFHHNTHLQLLERTKDLIRIYLNIDNAFTAKHMSMIWELMQQNDNELRPIIFKLINEIAFTMRDYHVIYFMQQIKELKQDQILIEHVQLLFEMNRYQIKNQELICMTIDNLWRIIEYAGQSQKQSLEDKSRQYLCDLIKNLEIKEIKVQMVQKLITNIQQMKVESSSIKTLSHLICSFPLKQQQQQQQQQQDNNIESQQTQVLTYPFVQNNPNLMLQQKIKEEIEQSTNTENKVEEITQDEFVKELIQQSNISQILRQNIENLRILNKGINSENLQESARYMNKLQERILLIKTLIKINGTAADIIDQQFLDLIWNEIILKPICKQECDMASNWLRDLVEKDEQFSQTQLDTFYRRLLNSDSHLTESAFNCFQAILYYINQKEYRLHRQQSNLNQNCDQYGNVISMTNTNVNENDQQLELTLLVDVNQIIGIEYLWHIVFNSQLDKAVQLLVKLNLSQQEQFIEKIVDKMDCTDEQTILKCLEVLRTLLNETETKGVGSLLSLDGLVKGDAFSINIINDMGDGAPSNRITIKVYSRMTMFELRKLIAKQLQTNWEQVKLVRNGVIVQDTDNGKTLKQMNVRKSEVINVYRRKTKPIPQVPLVEDKKLTPKFIKVLHKLFELYSTDGKMDAEQLSSFGMKAANDESFKDGKKIKELLDQYGEQKGYFSVENFISFYEDCCIQQKITSIVWKNLHSFGYKNDLTLLENDEVELDEQKLPRYQLAHNERFYRLMFHFINQSDQIAQECWKLLCSLPVFEAAKQRILNFEDFTKDRSYQLIYSIKIIEHLLYTEEYCRNFVKFGGFKQLQSILNNLEQENIKIVKLAQCLILNILSKHIAAQFQPKFNNIYQIQQHVKQPIQATFDIIAQLIDGTYPSSSDNKPLLRVKETEEFLELVKFMDGLDIQLDYVDLLKCIIRMQVDITDDRFIIEFVLILITTIVGYNLGNCLDYFVSAIQTIKQRYEQFLYAPKQLLIRKFAGNSLYLIFKSQNQLGKTLINILIELFPKNENKDSQSYFDLLAKLIQESKYSDKQFAENIIAQLKDYEPTESRIGLTSDKTLTGLLSILESLSIVDQSILTQQLIMYLYQVHLFCFHLNTFQLTPQKQYTPDYVKSKSPESRKIVYRIIILYLKQNYNPEILDLNSIIYQIIIFSGFDIKLNPKTYHGFVGIRNLGCICYMNAMMQQFFMTPEFRYSMLRAEDGVEAKIIHYKDNQGLEHQIDDNSIHQFQRLLAYLELSERPDVNPQYFCYSFKDYDNQPVNVSLQQDAQEFLNQFFDRLDNQLKNKGWQQFIESIYGGQTCSQMICNGCKNMREKFDLFYTLSVKVKGVKSIHESFESMINGEVIKDYYCEQCKQKNDLIKRQCLQTLPNVLIVHIQRIVFNLDIFMNEKLSTRLEFPHNLNLQQYTREGLLNQDIKQQSYYQYKLKGVVVHKGTAQYGHYYSLINTKDEKWLKFNDSVIEDFDIKRLPHECYGGKDIEDAQDFQESGSSTNAYILVYERIQKEQVELNFTDLQQKQEIMQKFDSVMQEENNEELSYKLDYKKMTQQHIPDSLYQEIWHDNHRFMMERHIYSEEFFRFVKEIGEAFPYPKDYTLITNPEQIPQYFGIYNNYQDIKEIQKIQQLLSNMTYIATELIARSSDHSTIKNYVLIIMNLINIIPTSAFSVFQHLIINRQQRIFNVLLCAPDYSVRQAIQQILLHYVNVIIYIHALPLNTESLQVLQPENTIVNCDQIMMRFLLDLIQKLQNDVAKNPTKFIYYFTFWRDFVKSSIINVKFASQIELVSIFADFFMEKQSPQGLQKTQFYEFITDKKITMASKMVVPFYSQLFQCIQYLLQDQNYILSKNDNICLQAQIFYKRALTECQDFETVKLIIQRMVFNNEPLSRSVIEVLLEEINKANYETVSQFLGLAYNLLNIYDAYQQQRIEWLLGFPEPNYQDKYSTGCSTNLSYQSILYQSHIGSQNDNLSILNLLFENQKRFQNVAIQMMKMILATANTNKLVFSYLVNLPPPCYLYSKYTDWFEGFLNEFLDDCKKYPVIATNIFFNKQKEVEETFQFWQQFKTYYSQITEIGLYDSIQPIYILGNTIKVELVSSVVQVEGVILECYEQTVYFIESKPTQTSNSVFPSTILYDNIYLQTAKIEPNSNIHNLVQQQGSFTIPKPPPLPKKMDVIDGIDFGTDVNKTAEQIKAEQESMTQLSQFSMELEHIVVTNKQNDGHNTIPIGQFGETPQQLIPCDIELQIAPMLKRFMLNNTTNQTLHITYQITLDPDFMVNFRHPAKICKVVPPHTTIYLTTIMKTIPSMDWGLFIETMDINFNEQNNSIPQQQPKKQVRIDEEVQVFMPNLKPETEMKSDDHIQCPICTYLQSNSNHFCEMCTFEFK
ncbi:unnamed protein product [Paramecium primaurelia]|uniref:Ubiquitinyl hydrolase 1 n=1 Tax=Paramecium primaurelia TaxID=5886 RepID=A0A8S1LJR9_PARPR|nr:unnamed protein product [Paramecium primaurelia]